MKILLFGGSFDPVHKGHTALLKSAVAALSPAAVHVMPTYHSPLKEKTDTPFALRMEMAKAAFKGIKGKIIFDDFENKRGEKTYSWQAVDYLKNKYGKEAEVFMLVGTDCLDEIHKWDKADYLLSNITVVAGRRKTCAGAACSLNATAPAFKHIFLDGEFPFLSSSALRPEIMLKGKVPALVNPGVKKVIEKNGLYGLNIHAWLKKNLTETRYKHSLAVASEGLALAEIHGINKEKIVLAGLLHDAGKCMTHGHLVTYCVENNIRPEYFDLICINGPGLLHSYVSADIAKKQFGLQDEEILTAVAEHTLGSTNMAPLTRLLFTADVSSKDRKYKEAAGIRILAKTDLNEALKSASRLKIIYTMLRGQWLCPQGIKTWNFLVKKQNM